MTSRPRRRHVAALAAVGTLLLSGCTFHPGSAAVVNGSDISQSKVDDLVLAACSFEKGLRLKTGGSDPATSVAALRHAILQALISFKVTDRAASQMHLTVSPAVLAKAASSNPTIPANVSDEDRALLKRFFLDSTLEQVQEAVIGAHEKDPSVTNADKVDQSDIKAAAKFLSAFTKRQSVSISPAFGAWQDGALVASDGSLSVPVSPAAKRWEALRTATSGGVEGLPPSLVCG